MSNVIVCHATCWACKFDQHYDVPAWHGWADPEDIEFALANGHADPSGQRCGCPCANE